MEDPIEKKEISLPGMLKMAKAGQVFVTLRPQSKVTNYVSRYEGLKVRTQKRDLIDGNRVIPVVVVTVVEPYQEPEK